MKTKGSSAIDRPDFLIIGSAKCGTTTLYDDLAKLNQLYLPSDKEPSILTRNQAIGLMQRDYRAHFGQASPGQRCGEGSTNYTKIPQYQGVAEKAYRLCGGELKLIMILRDPVQRIYSHLRHNIAVRRISQGDLDRVVLDDPIYVAVSDYAMQLRPWLDLFGKSNVFLVSFEDYRQNRTGTIQELGGFLGVSTDGLDLDEQSVRNKSSELRYTNETLGRVLGSSFYKRYFRRAVPDSVRGLYRKLLLPKADVPEISLSDSVQQELRARLGNVENEVEALVGKRIRINATQK